MYRVIVFVFQPRGYLFTQDCVFAASNENMPNVVCTTNLTALFSVKAFTVTFFARLVVSNRFLFRFLTPKNKITKHAR